MSSPDTIRIPLPDTERPRLLNSWKEIAAYLDRGVRTVQRWEATMGLPVHRPKGRLHSSVFALAHEIDRWLLKTPSARLDGDPLTCAARLRDQFEASRLLRKQARELAAQLRDGVKEHHDAYARLRQTLAMATAARKPRANAAAAPLDPAASNGLKTGSAA